MKITKAELDGGVAEGQIVKEYDDGYDIDFQSEYGIHLILKENVLDIEESSECI